MKQLCIAIFVMLGIYNISMAGFVPKGKDNLGNHTATKELNMNNYSVLNTSSVIFQDGTVFVSTKGIGGGGVFSNPPAGGGQLFGLNNTITNGGGILFGDNNSLDSDGIIFGRGNNVVGGNLVFGQGITSTYGQAIGIGTGGSERNSSVGIGWGFDARSYAIAIGENTYARDFAVAIGYYASAAGGYGKSIAIGNYASTDHYGVAIGDNASSGGYGGVAIGYYASAGGGQFASGYDTYPINDIYFGKGVSNAIPTAYTINGTQGLGTDIIGGDVGINGGASTGASDGGSIIFRTSAPGSSGSGINVPLSRVIIKNDGVSIGGTPIVAGLSVSTISYVTKINFLPQPTIPTTGYNIGDTIFVGNFDFYVATETVVGVESWKKLNP